MLRYFFILVLFYVFGSYLVNNKHEGMYIHADAEGYYLYLPAIFVYGTFKNIPYRTPDYFPKDPITGKVLDKYTSGTAILVSPFFLAAHFSRKIQGFHTPDPYAVDFSVAMLLAACAYATVGIYFLYHFLIQFFQKKVVILTIISLVFGTNVLHYITREPLLSHIYSFCLVAILLYLTPKFFNTKHETRNTKHETRNTKHETRNTKHEIIFFNRYCYRFYHIIETYKYCFSTFSVVLECSNLGKFKDKFRSRI